MKSNRFGKAQPLTTTQMEQLIKAAPSQKYALLWRLQRETAGRIGECLQLRWNELKGSHVVFRATSTKTKTTRTIPQSGRLREALEAYREAWILEHGHEPREDEYVFPGRFSTAEPITRQTADASLRNACKGLGWSGVSLHSFRRSAAQDAAAAGLPLHKIRALTGHASLDGLSHYLSATDDDILSCLELTTA